MPRKEKVAVFYQTLTGSTEALSRAQLPKLFAVKGAHHFGLANFVKTTLQTPSVAF
jgi:hypothetical protein